MYDQLIKRLREVKKMLTTANFNEASSLISQAADAIEELSSAGSIYGKAWTLGYDAGRDENKPRWIPVTERLPEKTNHYYLVHVKCGCDGELVSEWEQVAWFCEKFYWEHLHGDDVFEETVTHWMPLPEPPKEK